MDLGQYAKLTNLKPPTASTMKVCTSVVFEVSTIQKCTTVKTEKSAISNNAEI